MNAKRTSSVIAIAKHTQSITMTAALRYALWWSLLSISAVAAADECTLYMAVSSTSTVEQPTWGIYAGIDFDEGTELAQPDIAIQLFNVLGNAMDEHDSEEDDDETKSLHRKSVEMMERYTWVADSSAATNELAKEGKINTAIPGTALLAAYHDKFVNAAFNHTSAYFRPYLGETPGKAHPGRGASSHFYNVGMRATTIIPAGGELFLDYGQNFEVRGKEL